MSSGGAIYTEQMFTGTGQAEVRVNTGGSNGFARLDIDGDGSADMKIKFQGFFDFAETDFCYDTASRE